MKCPKCEKQNKPGVKNCEYCAEVMPVRKKRTTAKAKVDKDLNKTKSKTVSQNVKKNKTTAKEKVEKREEKIPIIELNDEKKALKKFVKRIKKIDKSLYIYFAILIIILLLILFINNSLHTITCTTSHNSETDKYNITLKIKKNGNNITSFKYITKNTINSDDEDLKSRYEIIIEELKKKDDFNKIVSSSLKRRKWEISYDFDEDSLDKTSEYIGIDLLPYIDDASSFVAELEEVGFTCK